jgi:hypothetical protein
MAATSLISSSPLYPELANDAFLSFSFVVDLGVGGSLDLEAGVEGVDGDDDAEILLAELDLDLEAALLFAGEANLCCTAAAVERGIGAEFVVVILLVVTGGR